MNEAVGICFCNIASTKSFLARSTEYTSTLNPRMLRALEPDVPVIIVKALGDRMRAGCVFRAIQAPARQQAGQLGDGNAEHLFGQDMIDAGLQVRDFRLQARDQPLGDLAQEHS